MVMISRFSHKTLMDRKGFIFVGLVFLAQNTNSVKLGDLKSVLSFLKTVK